MRHLIIFVSAAVIMVLGFIASLTMLGDQARLKQLLITHMEAQTGRHMAIDGHVSIRLFPRFRIDAREIRLSGPESFAGPDFLTSETLTAEIRLLPLMSGRVETRDVSLQGARLNLMVDETGMHSLGGLVRRPGRPRSQGIVSRGALRLEDIEIEIGSMAFGGSQQLAVDQVLLDGLAFDRLLDMSFKGAIGRPAVIESVTVNGLLFVPAGTGDFRLVDMKMAGRFAGAEQAFELIGALSFSAVPPLSMKLDEGRLGFGGRDLFVNGIYESRKRPYVSARLTGREVDAFGLFSMLGSSVAEDWLGELVDWVAANDFDLDLHAESMIVAGYRLAGARIMLQGADGVARVLAAQAGLPGAMLEVEGELRVGDEESTIRGLARLEVDDFPSLLAAARIDLDAEGAGQIVIRPGADGDAGAQARAELAFFDGRLAGLDRARELAGVATGDRFETLEGQLLIYPDFIVFPVLIIRDESTVVRLEGLVLRGSRMLSGQLEILLASGESMRFELAGQSNAPQFLIVSGDAAGQ